MIHELAMTANQLLRQLQLGKAERKVTATVASMGRASILLMTPKGELEIPLRLPQLHQGEKVLIYFNEKGNLMLETLDKQNMGQRLEKMGDVWLASQKMPAGENEKAMPAEISRDYESLLKKPLDARILFARVVNITSLADSGQLKSGENHKYNVLLEYKGQQFQLKTSQILKLGEFYPFALEKSGSQFYLNKLPDSYRYPKELEKILVSQNRELHSAYRLAWDKLLPLKEEPYFAKAVVDFGDVIKSSGVLAGSGDKVTAFYPSLGDGASRVLSYLFGMDYAKNLPALSENSPKLSAVSGSNNSSETNVMHTSSGAQNEVSDIPKVTISKTPQANQNPERNLEANSGQKKSDRAQGTVTSENKQEPNAKSIPQNQKISDAFGALNLSREQIETLFSGEQSVLGKTSVQPMANIPSENLGVYLSQALEKLAQHFSEELNASSQKPVQQIQTEITSSLSSENKTISQPTEPSKLSKGENPGAEKLDSSGRTVNWASLAKPVGLEQSLDKLFSLFVQFKAEDSWSNSKAQIWGAMAKYPALSLLFLNQHYPLEESSHTSGKHQNPPPIFLWDAEKPLPPSHPQSPNPAQLEKTESLLSQYQQLNREESQTGNNKADHALLKFALQSTITELGPGENQRGENWMQGFYYQNGSWRGVRFRFDSSFSKQTDSKAKPLVLNIELTTPNLSNVWVKALVKSQGIELDLENETGDVSEYMAGEIAQLEKNLAYLDLKVLRYGQKIRLKAQDTSEPLGEDFPPSKGPAEGGNSTAGFDITA